MNLLLTSLTPLISHDHFVLKAVLEVLDFFLRLFQS
jgi:hypothetical protein